MFYKNKISLIFAFSALLLCTITSIGFLWLRTSLPVTDGFIEVDGLTSPVSITRDVYGIPHIKGESENHVYFGLGFVHAQDRMWQMETARRAGAGRLSEIFGKRTLKLDKYLRGLGFYRAAEDSLNYFDKNSRANIEAYSAGINA